MEVEYNLNFISSEELFEFLLLLNNDFSQKLSEKFDLSEYSVKLIKNAVIYSSHYNNQLVGLIAFYANDPNKNNAYLSLLGVTKQYRKMGMASNLFYMSYEYLKNKNFNQIQLEVYKDNVVARDFYGKHNFKVIKEIDSGSLLMQLDFNK